MPPKPETPAEEATTAGMSNLVEKISKLTVANFAKPKPYVHGEDFRQFCVKFLRYIELNELSRPNLYLVFLSMLDNRTDEILNNVVLEETEKADAKAFCKKYITVFDPTITNDEVICELFTIKQEVGQSIDDFVYKIENISNKMNAEGINNALLEQQKKAAFINGLINDNLRLYLKTTEHKLLKEAVTYARKYEKYSNEKSTCSNVENISTISQKFDNNDFRERRDRDSPRRHERSWERRSGDTADRSRRREWSRGGSRSGDRRGNSAESWDRSRSRSRSGGRWRQGRPFNKIICYNCRKPGHKSNVCYSRNTAKNSENRHVKFDNTCSHCGRSNHPTKDCRYLNQGCRKCGKNNHVSYNCKTTRTSHGQVNKISRVENSSNDDDSDWVHADDCEYFESEDLN